MPDSQDLVRGASEKHMTYDELFVPWKISLLIYLFIYFLAFLGFELRASCLLYHLSHSAIPD
jgi:hypothetical protein